MTETFVIFTADGALARHPFAVGRSADVKDGPSAVRLLGRELVLWRSPSGNVVAAPDQCTHSRGILSHGHVKDGCLVCPKHGWTFGDTGRCVAKPSNMPITEKAHLRTYPCTERYGLIWVSLGEPATSIINVPWDGDAKYRRIDPSVSAWRSNPIQIIDTLLGRTNSPLIDVVADAPFSVRGTLKSESGAQHHRLLSCTPVDGRTSLVTSVIWTDSGDDDQEITVMAMADLADLKAVTEASAMSPPIVNVSDEDDTAVADWKRQLVAVVSP